MLNTSRRRALAVHLIVRRRRPARVLIRSIRGYWLGIMCLTGVDYFRTLAYQPSIAFESAGLVAPLATVILILVALFGALPVNSYVAARSSQGQGSIAMLEALMRGWRAKMIVSTSASFVLFGEGNVRWMVRELIRKHEPNSERQPRIVVG